MNRFKSRVAAMAAVGVLAGGLTAVAAAPASAAPGDPDAAFNTTMAQNLDQPDSFVDSIAVQTDGKIVTGGDYQGVRPTSNNLSRFNPDGTPDEAFNANVIAMDVDATVWSVAVQPDGKILAAGLMRNPGNRLIRLNPDGTLDEEFSNNLGNLLNGGVWDVRLQPDGKILIGGAFTDPANYLARLNADGTPDNTFNNNIGNLLDNWVQETEVLADGSIVAVGEFRVPTRAVVKFQSDGQLVAGFNANVGQIFNDDGQSVTVQSDGKILVTGAFDQPGPLLARLNSDGTADNAFNNALANHITPGFEEGLHVLATPQRIVFGGTFAPPIVTPTPFLTSFDYDGNPATTFNDRLATIGLDAEVQWLTQQENGKILVGGGFTAPNNALIRIDSEPPPTPEPPLPPLPGSTEPGKVTDLKTKKYSKKVKVHWKAPTDNGGSAITKYQAKIKKNGDWKKWKNVEPISNKKGKYKRVFKKLKPEKKYRVKVRAVNEVGNGKAVKKKFKTKKKS
jgi:uncharacterized delta-60 repeat protein